MIWTMILGDVSFSINEVIAASLGIFIAIPTTLTLYSQRKQTEANIWKGLYHASKEASEDQESRIVKLEAKVDLLQSEFVGEVAIGVAEAALKHFREEGLWK